MPIGRLMDALQSRELNELMDKLKQNSDAVEKQSGEISNLKGEIASLRKEISGLGTSSSDLSGSVGKAAESVKLLNDELEDSITDLKILKSQLQSKVAEKIEAEFRDILSRFEKDVDSVGRIKQDLAAMQQEFSKVRQEVERLSKISAGIKAEDFELSKFRHQLQIDSSEKIKLMQEIDTLQRMVSKMRRDKPVWKGPRQG